MSPTPTITGIPDLIRNKGQVTIWTRDSWADAWTLQGSDLLCVDLQFSTAGMPEATFRYHYGRIQQRSDLTVSTVSPIDLVDKWIKVILIPYNATSAEYVYWTGIVVREQRTHFGSDTDDVPCGDQIFTAYGGEYLLARTQISRAFVWDLAANDYFIIQRPISFNEFKSDRTGKRYLQGNKQQGKSYFAKDLKTGVEWTAKQIVNYLLDRHLFNTVEPELSTIDTGNGPLFIIDMAAELDYVPVAIETGGQTFYDVLNQLFNHKRGMTWWVEPITPGVELGFLIRVESMADQTVFDDEFQQQIVANTNQVNIDLQSSVDMSAILEVTDTSRRYSRVRAIGGRQGAVFTVRWGRFDRDWTTAKQNDYLQALYGLPAYDTEDRSIVKTANDAYRMHPSLRGVFTSFKMTDWDGNDWNFRVCFPDFNSGTVGQRDALHTIFESRSIWPESMRLLPYLPLKVGFDYSQGGEAPVDNNPAGTLTDFQRPLVVSKVLDGKGNNVYSVLDTERVSAGRDELRRSGGSELEVHFTPHDHQLGFSVTPNGLPHLMQKDVDFYDDDPVWPVGMSHTDFGETDWAEMLVTVYAQCDDEIFYEHPPRPIDWAAQSHYDVVDTLDVRVGDRCRVDYLLRETLLGVQRTDLSAVPTLVQNPAPMMIRDDRDKLQRIAFEVWSWYQTERKALRISWNRLRGDVKVGMLVKRIQISTPTIVETPELDQIVLPDGEFWILDDDSNEQVNSVVSTIVHNVEAGTTAIQTQFIELDFAEVFG